MPDFPFRLGAKIADPPAEAWRFPARAARSDTTPQRWLRVPTPMRDQGDMGSCVGQSGSKALEVLDGRGVQLSAVGAYRYGTIASGFDPAADDGCFPEAAVRSWAEGGIGSAALLPYSRENLVAPPPESYVAQAKDHRVLSWYRALTADAARSALASGYPVLMAFDVRQAFEDVGRDGEWREGGASRGGHMTLIVGRDDYHTCPGYPSGAFFSLNWWGPNWGAVPPGQEWLGRNGFWVPYVRFGPGTLIYDALVIERYDAQAGD